MTDEKDGETIYDGDDSSNGELDWQNEADNLSSGGGGDYGRTMYVSIPEGNHRVTFKMLDDGNQQETKQGPKVFFDVEVVSGKVNVYDPEEDEGTTMDASEMDALDDDVELTYSVYKGQTETSQFGQIAQVAAARGGLEGEEIEIMRRGKGTDTQYAVLEDEIEG